MGSCTNLRAKCKNHTFQVFGWFAQWNMESNYLMLNINMHEMLQQNKFMKPLWIRHSLCVQDWSLCPMGSWHTRRKFGENSSIKKH
jgi:hypothetical protein